MVRIEFHPEAVNELEASADWYAEQSPTAAREFALAVDAALNKIRRNPQRFLKIDRRHQSCSVIRYPFQVVYRYESDRIYVVAIAHAKRRSGYWRSRSP